MEGILVLLILMIAIIITTPLYFKIARIIYNHFFGF